MKKYLPVSAILLAIGLSAWAIPRVQQWQREAPVKAQLDELEGDINQIELMLPIRSVESYNSEWCPLARRADELKSELWVVNTGPVGADLRSQEEVDRYFWLSHGDSALSQRFRLLVERLWRLQEVANKAAWNIYSEQTQKRQ